MHKGMQMWSRGWVIVQRKHQDGDKMWSKWGVTNVREFLGTTFSGVNKELYCWPFFCSSNESTWDRILKRRGALSWRINWSSRVNRLDTTWSHTVCCHASFEGHFSFVCDNLTLVNNMHIRLCLNPKYIIKPLQNTLWKCAYLSHIAMMGAYGEHDLRVTLPPGWTDCRAGRLC